MKKHFIWFCLLAIAAPLFAAPTWKAEPVRREVPLRQKGKEAGMLLDLQKISIGTLSDVEERKQYLSTIQLEKQRIQNYTLRMVYDNAYRLYRHGDYQRAQELAQTILTIDPNFSQAQTLAKQATFMNTYGTASEKEVIDAKLQEAQRLYNSGRLVEANQKLDEVLTIRPNQATAKNWRKRIDLEIANEYVRRGHEAYAREDYQGALDNWYNTLLIRKDDNALVNRIAQTENLLRKQQVEAAMEEALSFYNQGKYLEAYSVFERITKIQPGDARAQKYMMQLKDEIADGYYVAGNKSFNSKRYDTAISYWTNAKKWGSNPLEMDALIKKARNAKETALRKQQEAASRPARPVAPEPTLEPEPEPEPIEVLPTPEPITGEDPGGLIPAGPTRVSEEASAASRQKYIEGLDAFNQDDYERARAAWIVAKQLDPGNTDADLGLRKVEEITGMR